MKCALESMTIVSFNLLFPLFAFLPLVSKILVGFLIAVGDDFRLTNPSLSTEQDRPQPHFFKGKLKIYQLKV